MDFIGDLSGRHILHLSTIIDAPPYVKEASVVVEDVIALPDSAFALPHKREFPVDSPGHVWLGYAYCKSAGIQDPDLVEKLKQAGRLFLIEDNLVEIDQVFDDLVKSASVPAKAFAVSIDFGTPNPEGENYYIKAGGVHGFYPINTAAQIESSAVKLANDRINLPMEVFAEACRNLVKAAKEHRVQFNYLPGRVLDYGIERLVDATTVRHYAELRKQATGDDFYTELAESAIRNEEGVSSHEYAELWENADRINGVKVASRNEPDPFVIFNSGITVEEAERQLETWVDLHGAPVPLAKVAAIKEADVRKWFAKPLADQLMTLVKQAGSAKGSEMTAAFSDLDKAVVTTFVKRLLES